MNTAKPNTQNGSESCNAMGLESPAMEKLNKQRELFAGPRMKRVDLELGAVIFIQVVNEQRIYMMGFSGRKAKPDFYRSFESMDRAEKYRDSWHKKLVVAAESKAVRKAERVAQFANLPTFAVGDVLVSSWGYEQTNYTYYQITRLVGAKSVEIREIARQAEDTEGTMGGECVPLKDAFTGPAMVKRIDYDGSVKVRSWGAWARKKESVFVGGIEIFKPDRYTSYY